MFKKLIFIISLAFTLATPAHAIDGFVKITSPNGGTFTEGDTMHIAWESSPNIDQINIGYKSCPSCLDWVVFTTPNTGSYNWKVNVGNTTNTQFYLQITGYETGKGSLTSNSGTFTVIQNPPLFTTPSSTPISTPPTSTSPTPTPNNFRNIVYPSNYPKSYNINPTPTPRPFTPRLSVTNLVLYSEFIFEGSITTDLKNISDPQHVDNFTLDTMSGYTFIFQETLDLTDQKTLAALQNTKDYWQYEAWFIWIKWEWWIKYDIEETIAVEYKNDALTAYAPTLDTTPSSPAPIHKTKSSPAPAPSVLGAEAGKIKLAVSDGTPVKIKPRVELDTPKSPVSSSIIELTGHTSHSNLTWTLNHNGNKSSVNPIINSDTGEFSIPVGGLIQGANTFVLTYQVEDYGQVSIEPVTVILDQSFWDKYGKTIFTILTFLTVFVAGFLFPKIPPKIKKSLKPKKLIKKK